MEASDCRWVRGQLDLGQAELAELFRVDKSSIERIEGARMRIPGAMSEVYNALLRGLERFSRPPAPTDPHEALWHGEAVSPRSVIWGPEPQLLGQRYLRIFLAAYGLGADAEPGTCTSASVLKSRR